MGILKPKNFTWCGCRVEKANGSENSICLELEVEVEAELAADTLAAVLEIIAPYSSSILSNMHFDSPSILRNNSTWISDQIKEENTNTKILANIWHK